LRNQENNRENPGFWDRGGPYFRRKNHLPMKNPVFYCSFGLLLLIARCALGQGLVGGLPRQAALEMTLRFVAPNTARIAQVQPGGRAEAAGLRVDDQVTSINGQPFADPVALASLRASLRGGQPLRLALVRSGQPLTVAYTPAARPVENPPNSTAEYGSLALADGTQLRTLVTRPRHKTGKLPAILLVQWLSCSSVEVPGPPTDGADLLVQHFANHPDLVFMRVEKPGVGDSQGNCATCDLATELQMHRAALAALKKRPEVDTSRVYLLGISLGAGLSAVLGQGQNIKGYLVTGACTTTWFEHMMELERRRLALSGIADPQINARMGGYATLYQKYYIEQMTPGQVVAQAPALQNLWYDQPAHQYGRPAAFYHQVQALNFEAAWARVNVPVLALYGEYDWVMSLADHEKIVKLVNRNGAGLAELIVIPKANHNLSVFATPQQAFDETDGQLPDQLIGIVENWWKKQRP
jgi:pimeloyl-ACP methyl ester carboxylesterase